MKYLMNRDEYLNEGFKDTIKKGINAVKNIFSIVMKKIKNFIGVFTSDGKMLPVVAPQSLVDHYSKSDTVHIFAPKYISDLSENAGGNSCGNNASYKEDNGYEDEYEEGSLAYENFLSMASLIKESLNISDDNMIEESQKDIYKNRIDVDVDNELKGIASISSQEFREELEERIETICENDDPDSYHSDNMLIWGAPGVGKSTIPRTLCQAYNEGKLAKDKICLMLVDTQNLTAGDFLMPAIPTPKEYADILDKESEGENENEGEDKSMFSKSKEIISKMSPKRQEAFYKSFASLKQYEANVAPQHWLPVFRPTGDNEIDAVLDDIVNRGVHIDKGTGESHKTGSGGFILFDEYLRAERPIFKQLMTLLIDREIDKWRLGSKWSIIACSNRPKDSEEVSKVWEMMNKDGAIKDRMPVMYVLNPDAESWKDYAKEKLHCPEIILDFIFDDNTKIETGRGSDEYPRWHSILNSDARDTEGTDYDNSVAQAHPITPRTWQKIIERINFIMKKGDYKDFLDIPRNVLTKKLKGHMDEDFLDEFIHWLDDNTGHVNVEDIMKDPHKVKPKKIGSDEYIVNIIRNIKDQMTRLYNDGKGKAFTSDEISNVVWWLGTYYPDAANSAENDFIQHIDEFVSTDDFDSFMEILNKSIITFIAAYPSKKMLAQLDDEESDLREGTGYDREKLKKLMRELGFDRNIDENDEIIPYRR